MCSFSTHTKYHLATYCIIKVAIIKIYFKNNINSVGEKQTFHLASIFFNETFGNWCINILHDWFKMDHNLSYKICPLFYISHDILQREHVFDDNKYILAHYTSTWNSAVNHVLSFNKNIFCSNKISLWWNGMRKKIYSFCLDIDKDTHDYNFFFAVLSFIGTKKHLHVSCFPGFFYR